jgi:hypothetical protein
MFLANVNKEEFCEVFLMLHHSEMLRGANLYAALQPQDSRPPANATLQVTGAVGWRREGLVYKKNEVCLHALFVGICAYSYFLLACA